MCIRDRPTTIDSYTRQNRYEEAEVGIKESIHTQKSMLNGFPAVNHGVFGCRSIIENLDTPVQVRHGTPDARLLTEICYAGGFTSYEGGGISYNIPYAKDVPLERTIYDWMYVDRLTGIYEEAGVSINREPYGPLTGTLVPPSMSNAVAIIAVSYTHLTGSGHPVPYPVPGCPGKKGHRAEVQRDGKEGRDRTGDAGP